MTGLNVNGVLAGWFEAMVRLIFGLARFVREGSRAVYGDFGIFRLSIAAAAATTGDVVGAIRDTAAVVVGVDRLSGDVEEEEDGALDIDMAEDTAAAPVDDDEGINWSTSMLMA